MATRVLVPSLTTAVLFIDAPPRHTKGEQAAMVVKVTNDRLVNVVAWDSTGNPSGYVDVPLLQAGDKPPKDGAYCKFPTPVVERPDLV